MIHGDMPLIMVAYPSINSTAGIFVHNFSSILSHNIPSFFFLKIFLTQLDICFQWFTLIQQFTNTFYFIFLYQYKMAIIQLSGYVDFGWFHPSSKLYDFLYWDFNTPQWVWYTWEVTLPLTLEFFFTVSNFWMI